MIRVALICPQRQSCVDKAREVLKEPTDVPLDEYVTDRFLCSGGSSGYKDAVSCKGLGLCTYRRSAYSVMIRISLSGSLSAQATQGDPCFCNKGIVTFRSALF